MGKFSKIKKYNLKSLSIDEKIKFLDKEMEKTGLNEIAANSTPGVYTVTGGVEGQPTVFSDVPNTSNVGGEGFTQNTGGSGVSGEPTSHSDLSQLFNSTSGIDKPIFVTPDVQGAPASFGIVKYSGTGAANRILTNVLEVLDEYWE